jgi:2-hydroxy-6-oxonona-2,4-dienedioate hydrolase
VRHASEHDPGALVASLDAAARRETTFGPAGRTVWRRWGQGPPLVLLHGASGSWTHWIRNIPRLAARFTVLAVDMPGFGDSDDVPEPHTVETLAEAVGSGLQALVPAAEIRLAGFSLGGIVAGVVAARLGRRLSSLVVIGPGGLGMPSGAGGLRLQRVREGMSAADMREVHRANLGLLMFATPAAADALAVHVQVDNLRRARFRSGDIPTSDTLLRALPAIRAPLAGIWGDHDAFAAPDIGARRDVLLRYHPGADVRVVAGAGHWVNYEVAEVVNRALLEILSRERPGAPPGSA